MRAIQARRAGGPDVLELVDLPDPTPGPGEILVRTTAAGINFIDTYRRGGVYPMPFPHVPGDEGAGVVAAVGQGVTDLAEGDRVAWADAPGSYAGFVRVKAERALRVPDGVELDVAAALPLQGLTAHYLATSHLPGAAGRHDPGARRRRRRRPAAHPARHRPGGPGDHHGLHRGEGEAVPRRRRRRRDPLRPAERPDRRAAGPGAGAGRRRGSGRLRRGRTLHLRRLAGLPAAPGDDGAVRGVQRPGAAVRHPAAQLGRLAVPHPPHAGPPRQHRRRTARPGRRAVRRRDRRAGCRSASGGGSPSPKPGPRTKPWKDARPPAR